MKKVLDGVRVLSCTHILMGPWAGKVLAELGGEVIRIERMEPTLPFGIIYKGRKIDLDEKLRTMRSIGYWRCGQKSLALDLRSVKGKKILMKLVKKSDVFLQNYSPGSMERLGLGYEDMKKVNPKIIYASGSSWGHTGPLKNAPGWDALAQARTGLMKITGYPDSPPVFSPLFAFDYGAGMYLALAILAALWYRERTGRGQSIDISLFDVGVAWMFWYTFDTEYLGITLPRIGNRDFHLPYPATDTFESKDGYVFLMAPFHWDGVARAIGREDLIDEPRYDTMEKRAKMREELDCIVAKWAKTKTAEEIVALMVREGVPAERVRTVGELINDPQAKARGMIVELEHVTLGKIPVAGSPLKMSETPGTVETLGHPLGYDNEEICEMLGYTEEEIANLKQERVIA
ncbi:MAG: CaiB/BaiF CoA transferase family protein [Candidatus Hodarchaeota archaeon]